MTFNPSSVTCPQCELRPLNNVGLRALPGSVAPETNSFYQVVFFLSSVPFFCFFLLYTYISIFSISFLSYISRFFRDGESPNKIKNKKFVSLMNQIQTEVLR